jgi:hypothetical protein
MEVLLLVGLGVLALIVTASVLGSLLRALFWLIALPFRFAFWLLLLPIHLLKLVFGVLGAVLSPIGAVLAAVAAAIVAGVFVPLVPVLVIAFFVWLIVRMARPAHRPTAS